jgi:putative transposase
MANTYTQIHIHAIFAVNFRLELISDNWKEELYRYITGIISNHRHKLIAINGMPDHVHILFGMRPSQSLSDLMQDIKGNSSKWINEKKFCIGRFEWQEGFAAFSYSKADLSNVISYIKNQDEHHRQSSFNEEYSQLLNEFSVAYDEKFTFRAPV